MHELELAGHPSIDPRLPAGGRVAVALPRAALVGSVVAHVVAGYALSLYHLSGPAPASPTPDFFLFEMPAPPRPAEPSPQPAPPQPAEEPAPETDERPPEPVPEPVFVVEPPSPSEVEPPDEILPLPPTLRTFIDFDEERRRAAAEVVDERARESEFLTFTLDDVAPPRPAPEPEPPPSIFDGDGSGVGGRSVGTVGQQRTKFGRKLAEICNALTGGFGFALQGFGLFSACAKPDEGPSGWFPEVRPAYLDLMPECVDTRDTAPALALEAPFPTVKCRLVRQQDPGRQP